MSCYQAEMILLSSPLLPTTDVLLCQAVTPSLLFSPSPRHNTNPTNPLMSPPPIQPLTLPPTIPHRPTTRTLLCVPRAPTNPTPHILGPRQTAKRLRGLGQVIKCLRVERILLILWLRGVVRRLRVSLDDAAQFGARERSAGLLRADGRDEHIYALLWRLLLLLLLLLRMCRRVGACLGHAHNAINLLPVLLTCHRRRRSPVVLLLCALPFFPQKAHRRHQNLFLRLAADLALARRFSERLVVPLFERGADCVDEEVGECRWRRCYEEDCWHRVRVRYHARWSRRGDG
ncbi:uncharacterized protein IWZ02DRAFT_15254 [Phyllosticta citriasiana]|uniref:uncharacterized protein n=1 Tax=Phyllosticta citriasiana TaxID=595635 RepID=UPI0030FDF315